MKPHNNTNQLRDLMNDTQSEWDPVTHNDGEGQPEIRSSVERSEDLLDASLRVHATEVVEYILRGNGRRIVPKAIYLAAWEIQYALNRKSN